MKNDENIYIDKDNYNMLYSNVISNIIFSIYRRNYKTIANEMLEHKKFSIHSDIIVNDIKNKRKLIDNDNSIDYKKLFMKKYNIKFKSDQTYVSSLVYKKLGHNYKKIDSTMIGTIIIKIYNAYTSYFNARKKDYKSKAKLPNFLRKDDKFTLNFAISKAKVDPINKNIRIFTSKYLNKNYDLFDINYVKLSENKYIHKHYLVSRKNKKNKKSKMKIVSTKKNSYIYNKKVCIYKDDKSNYSYNKKIYILKDNKHIIDSGHIYVPYCEFLHDKEMKTIEVNFENGRIKYCINYVNKVNLNLNLNQKNTNIIANDTISIDLGIKNLLTIYDPIGKSIIIPGNFLVSTNSHYKELIGKAQSNNDESKFLWLQNKRKCIINNYFNLIVKWLENNYSHKKMFIIGHNKEWKHNCNLGKQNNFTFIKIPYAILINKIKDKFNNKNITIKTNEESYTSKCDSLSLEKIGKPEKGLDYLGKRIKRGLFSSSQHKLINADVNGAINIMRKVFKTFKNENSNQNVFNPKRINIFHEVYS